MPGMKDVKNHQQIMIDEALKRYEYRSDRMLKAIEKQTEATERQTEAIVRSIAKLPASEERPGFLLPPSDGSLDPNRTDMINDQADMPG